MSKHLGVKIDTDVLLVLNRVCDSQGFSQSELVRDLIRLTGELPGDNLRDVVADGLRLRMFENKYPIPLADTKTDDVFEEYKNFLSATCEAAGIADSDGLPPEFHFAKNPVTGSWAVLHMTERFGTNGEVENVFKTLDAGWQESYQEWMFRRQAAQAAQAAK